MIAKRNPTEKGVFGLKYVEKQPRVQHFFHFYKNFLKNLQIWAVLVNAINAKFLPNKCEILNPIFAKNWLPWWTVKSTGLAVNLPLT